MIRMRISRGLCPSATSLAAVVMRPMENPALSHTVGHGEFMKRTGTLDAGDNSRTSSLRSLDPAFGHRIAC